MKSLYLISVILGVIIVRVHSQADLFLAGSVTLSQNGPLNQASLIPIENSRDKYIVVGASDGKLIRIRFDAGQNATFLVDSTETLKLWDATADVRSGVTYKDGNTRYGYYTPSFNEVDTLTIAKVQLSPSFEIEDNYSGPSLSVFRNVLKLLYEDHYLYFLTQNNEFDFSVVRYDTSYPLSSDILEDVTIWDFPDEVEITDIFIFQIDGESFMCYTTSDGGIYKVNHRSLNGTVFQQVNQVALPEIGNIRLGFLYQTMDLAFFIATNDEEIDTVVKFDLRNFEVVGNPFQLEVDLSSAYSGVIDDPKGRIYVGTERSVAYVLDAPKSRPLSNRINFGLSEGIEIRLSTVVLDSENFYAYYGSEQEQGIIYRIAIPETCPSGCSGRGECIFGTCNCTAVPPNPQFPGYTGDGCQLLRCIDDCNGNGECLNTINEGEATCNCDLSWTGPSCAQRTCPRGCSGHGNCNADFVCECFAGYIGEDCLELAPITCEDITTCGLCVANSSCGWCATTSTCSTGGIEGPQRGSCMDWHYDTCPKAAVYVFAFLFTAIAALLLLINMVSLFISDKNAPPGRPNDVEVRGAFWRNQRSAKAWHLIDQIQFTALTGLFGVHVPSIYQSFVSIFRWTLLGFGNPWSSIENEPVLARDIQSMKQYANSLTDYPEDVFLGTLFWTFLLICVVSVFFGLVFIIAKHFNHDNLRIFVINRYIYTLLRVALFAFVPLGVTAAYALTEGGTNGAAAAIGGILLLVFNLGTIGFVAWILPRNKRHSSRLFSQPFLKKFGCLYNSYYFRRCWYMIIILVRKFAIILIIGLVQSEPAVQIVLVSIVHLAYLAQLFFTKPYLDHVHMFLDAVTTAANLLVTLSLFGFLSSVEDRELRTAFSIIAMIFSLLSMVLCVIFFIDSWLKLKNIHSIRQLIDRCRGRDNNDPSKQVGLNDEIEMAKTD